MSWISNFVKPKLDSLLTKRDVPDNLWRKCDKCEQLIFHRELTDALYVCPRCGAHMLIPPHERLASLFDHGAFSVMETSEPPRLDPLQFRDVKRYSDRLRAARKSNRSTDAMLVAEGAIGGTKSVVAIQNFAFMAGSMGIAVGNAFIEATNAAIRIRAPLVVFVAAGGARMQEGIFSLMQMPRTTAAVQMLREAGLPYISVFTDPTTGGVTASFAMLGDVHIAEPGALICFAGPRVIEQTIKETLPTGFQRAEYLLEHGMLDMVVARAGMREALIRLLRLLTRQPPLPAGALPPTRPPSAAHESSHGAAHRANGAA